VTSDQFRQYFVGRFPSLDLHADFWETAFYSTGLGSEAEGSSDPFSNSLSDAAWNLAARWVAGTEGLQAAELDGWSSQQRCILLERLQEASKTTKLSLEVLQAMDQLYSLSDCTNAEIKFRWQALCLACSADFIVPKVVEFVASQGRMKYVRPLYRALNALSTEIAVATFKRHADSYHPIARKMLEADLKLGTLKT
jgi:leukotriene-A4 hydrolase